MKPHLTNYLGAYVGAADIHRILILFDLWGVQAR
jgi:hypothetical protein